MSKVTKYEDRILGIIDRAIENKEELKTPILSLVNHVHELGIVGDEDEKKIVAVIQKALDDLGEKSVHVTGAYRDAQTIKGVLKKIFNW